MTQVVTVHTDFTDLNQMTQGLIGRVNDTHVILPAGDPVDVGEWVQFAVTLYDGSPAFAGVGRCVTFVDNGEDRLPHQRFDVVFDSLQFDDRARQIYEHILSLSGLDLEPGSEGDAVPEGTGRFVDVSSDFSGSGHGAEGDPTVAASAHELQETLSQSAVHAVSGNDIASLPPEDADEGHSTAPPQPATWAGLQANGVRVPYQARPINGTTFSYPEGLPLPSEPPRPDLDPNLRVTPAPRPEQ